MPSTDDKSVVSKKSRPNHRPGRLYVKGVFTGFRRGLRNQKENTALLRVDGVFNIEDAKWYAGKRKKKLPRRKNPSKVRVIWGKILRPHGRSGAVRAKFRRNLPPKGMGHRVRIMLYPSRI